MPSIDISAVIALAALLQSPAAAEAVRQPKGKWIVDYADSMCVLQRDYGTAKSTLSLGIRRALMGDHDQLIVLTSARSGNNRMGVPATLSAEAGVVAVPTEAQSFFNRQQSLRLNQMEIPQALLSRSSGTQVLEVRVPGLVNERFAVPGLSDALAVLDECVVDLLEGWGVPRSEQRNLSSFAKPLVGACRYLLMTTPRPRYASFIPVPPCRRWLCRRMGSPAIAGL